MTCKKISKDEMFPLILESYPSFRTTWVTSLEENTYEKEILYYLILSDLARHIIKQHISGDTAEFPLLFNIIETLLLTGDSYVVEAIIVGLLEDLQNMNLWPDTTISEHSYDPDVLIIYLEKETRKRWQQVIDFWEKGILIPE